MTHSADLLILSTGGTIDKVYNHDGELVIGPPAAAWLLKCAGLAGAFQVETVLAKDSLDITDADRSLIAERVRRVASGGVVITHGTDTMTTTADYLRAHKSVSAGVTVVITGAMQPASMRDSDAAFNLGAAISAVQLLPSGVHVAMSGQTFRAGTVVKDRLEGRFKSL